MLHLNSRYLFFTTIQLFIFNIGLFLMPIAYSQNQNLLPPLEDWTVNFGVNTDNNNVHFDEPNLLTLDYDSLANQSTVLYSPLLDCSQVETASIRYFYESYHNSALIDTNYKFAFYIVTNSTNIGTLTNDLLNGSEAGLTKIFEKTGEQGFNIYEDDLSNLIAGESEVYFVIRGISAESESIMRFIRPQINATYAYHSIKNWDYASNSTHPDTTYVDDFTIESIANRSHQIDTLSYEPFDLFSAPTEAYTFDFSYLLDNKGETAPNLQPSIKVVVETEQPDEHTIFQDSGDTNGEYISKSIKIDPAIVSEGIKAIHVVMTMPVTEQRVGFSLRARTRSGLVAKAKQKGGAAKVSIYSCLQQDIVIYLNQSTNPCSEVMPNLNYVEVHLSLADQRILDSPIWKRYVLIPHDQLHANFQDTVSWEATVNFPIHGKFDVKVVIPEEAYGHSQACTPPNNIVQLTIPVNCCESLPKDTIITNTDDWSAFPLLAVDGTVQLGYEQQEDNQNIIHAADVCHIRSTASTRFYAGFTAAKGSYLTVVPINCSSLSSGKTNKANKQVSFPKESHYAKFVCYPNPTSSNLTIDYALKESAIVSLKVYNILGLKQKELLVSEQQEIGHYTLFYALDELVTGIYFLQLQVNDQLQTIKLIKVQ